MREPSPTTFGPDLTAHVEAEPPEPWTMTELWVQSLDKTLAKIGIGTTAGVLLHDKCHFLYLSRGGTRGWTIFFARKKKTRHVCLFPDALRARIK